jgi:hypothetical protein
MEGNPDQTLGTCTSVLFDDGLLLHSTAGKPEAQEAVSWINHSTSIRLALTGHLGIKHSGSRLA